MGVKPHTRTIKEDSEQMLKFIYSRYASARLNGPNMDESSDWIRYICIPKAGDEIEKLQEIVDTTVDMPKVVYFLI